MDLKWPELGHFISDTLDKFLCPFQLRFQKEIMQGKTHKNVYATKGVKKLA